MPKSHSSRFAVLLVTVLCIGDTMFVETAGQQPAADRAVVAFARDVSVRALTFQQGDGQAFFAVRSEFTPDGWTQFQSGLKDWLDVTGAPVFGSTFVPAGGERIVDQENGITHVRVPGALTHLQNQSRTIYRRAAVDVWVRESPMAVQRLTQTTCLGASTACQ
jgi:hypothetical protein